MRKLFLVALLLFSNVLFSQKPWIGVYNPVKGEQDKKLVITSDSTFLYTDHSSGSCSVWISAFGNWKVKQDTLLLICKDNYDTAYSRIAKFEIGFCRLTYTDTSDKNIFTSWGDFVFIGFGRITEKTLKLEVRYLNYYNIRLFDSGNRYDLYVDEYGRLKRKRIHTRWLFHFH